MKPTWRVHRPRTSLNQDLKPSQSETREGRTLANIDALPEELSAQIVDQVRSWTLVEDEEERVEMRM